MKGNILPLSTLIFRFHIQYIFQKSNIGWKNSFIGINDQNKRKAGLSNCNIKEFSANIHTCLNVMEVTQIYNRITLYSS